MQKILTIIKPGYNRWAGQERLEGGEMFEPERPKPKSDREALIACEEVLTRIMRDNLLCGKGTTQGTTKNQIERPLYGCALRALTHLRQRMATKP